MKDVKYQFYATILDAFQNYLSSSSIFQTYWGNSENPKKTEQEFEEEQFQSLLDRINRVPFESEPADKGTAFNEVIDCLIENRKPSEKFQFKTHKDLGVIAAAYKSYVFEFPLKLCLDFKNRFDGAMPQYRTEAILPTKYGDVLLYGYIDELLPDKVVDIKTTSKYNAFKFRDHWQHMVYPYCLIEDGNLINTFEYVVTDFKSVYSEVYVFNPERDVPRLTTHVERFIEFLESNRDLITDKKIFNNDIS